MTNGFGARRGLFGHPDRMETAQAAASGSRRGRSRGIRVHAIAGGLRVQLYLLAPLPTRFRYSFSWSQSFRKG